MSHTPGPWIVDAAFDDSGYVRGPRGEYVADIELDEDDPVLQANARLIAAAPELLAVLQRYVIEAEASGGWEGDDALFKDATVAIALAEGRE